MTRCILIFAALVAAFTVGCGGTPPSPRPSQPATKLLRGPASCDPKPGAGVMGACQPKPVSVSPGKPTLTLHGRFVPDVSYYQGHPNWASAKRWGIAGAIIRVADGSFNDPAFAYNWRELRRLHVWHAVYYFLRPGNCTGQADRAVGLVNAQGGLDSGPLIEDAEVALDYGCQHAFSREVEHRTGWHVTVDYSSQGTWPGGPVDPNTRQWDAAYGPVPGCFLSPCHRVAWQATDGVIGPFPHCITGIGCGDVSRDEGITRIARHRPKPKPNSRLIHLIRYRTHLRAVLLVQHCRVRYPNRHCRGVLRSGAQVNHQIRSLGGR